MIVQQAREAAREWVRENAGRLPGLLGAYTAGSTNWLAGDAEVADTSDLDVTLVVGGVPPAAPRRKFLYRGTLLEVSELRPDRFQSAESLLSHYHLAPSFHTATLLLDPTGELAALREAVRRQYAEPRWIIRRCAHARSRVEATLASIRVDAPLHDQVLPLLFGTGITTHILLAAGLQNPTVRSRYTAVREFLSDCGRLPFHETLLELLGAAHIGKSRAAHHATTLAGAFDAAAAVMRSPFDFAPDVSPSARRIAIDGSLEAIARGDHREAMFWIAVTHTRCRMVLAQDAPEIAKDFAGGYRNLLADMGVASPAEIRRRSAEVARGLPAVWEIAEAIVAEKCGNPRLPLDRIL